MEPMNCRAITTAALIVSLYDCSLRRYLPLAIYHSSDVSTEVVVLAFYDYEVQR